MYSEVEKYVAALKAAEEAYSAAVRALGETFPNHDYSGAPCARCKAARPINTEMDRAEQAAWDSLKESRNPLVRWIAETCDEYKPYAQAVLEMFPASMDELNELARRHGWCPEWDRFKRMAERAGVLPAEVSADTEVSA